MAEADVAPETTDQEEESTPQHCYHCGRRNEATNLAEDWLCPRCGHYQLAVTCPTCHQVANRTLMEQDAVPAAAKARK